MKKIYLALFTLMLSGIYADLFGQKGYEEGYVVMNSGDTLYGMLKDRKSGSFPRLYEKVKFRNEKGKKRFYGPAAIRAYGWGNQVFRSLHFTHDNLLFSAVGLNEGERRFLKVHVSGYLTLYEDEFIDHDGPTIEGRFYLKKADEHQFIHVPWIGFRKSMISYFNDDPVLSEAIQRKKYRYADIRQLVREYNQRRIL